MSDSKDSSEIIEETGEAAEEAAAEVEEAASEVAADAEKAVEEAAAKTECKAVSAHQSLAAAKKELAEARKAPVAPKKVSNPVPTKKKNPAKILTIVECIILGVFSLANAFFVYRLAQHDPYYRLYYFFTITGVLMLGLMIIAYFKKWLAVQLLSVLVVLLWVTYTAATIYSCILTTRVIKREEPYRNSEMCVVFNGKLYVWQKDNTVMYGLPADWEDLELRKTVAARDDSKTPTEELHSKGVDEGCVIFYQDNYKYILVEVVTGSLFEFVDPNDLPEDTIPTATTTLRFA